MLHIKYSVLLTVISLIVSSLNAATLTDDDYELLPPIYQIDSFNNCTKLENMYCKADIKLNPTNPDMKLWKLVEKTRNDPFLYNHDEVYRTICVPRKFGNDQEKIQNFIYNYVNKEFQHNNLYPTIENVSCNKFHHETTTEYIIKKLAFIYAILLIYATVYDWTKRSNNSHSKEPVKVNKVLIALSLRSNFEKLFQFERNDDYQKLKCMQGLRIFNSIFVIWIHVVFSYLHSFPINTKFIEEEFPYLFYYFLIFGGFVIQSYLLMSSWLLTIQVLNIFEANKEFTLKNAALIFIHRCIRLLPVSVYIILSIKRSYWQIFNNFSEPVNLVLTGCENYWWSNLLFVNNNYVLTKTCYGGTWYVSVDTQLYLTALVITYFMLKFKLRYKLLLFLLLCSCLLFGVIIYINDLDIIFRPSKVFFFFKKYSAATDFVYLYTIIYVNLPTCILGICFGVCYNSIKNRTITNKKIFVPFWITSFLGLPVLSAYIASKQYNGLSAALIGPILKPLYAFGVGMGILGMSQNTGGFLKKIFEWKLFEFLSQFTFCTYMFHFIITYFRTNLLVPTEVSYFNLAMSSITDVILGFGLGFIMHLIIELPASNIQKMLIPKVRKKSLKSK